MAGFDPIRILEVLADHGVESVVVGGTGGVIHGTPLNTDDVDIVPALRLANLDSLAAALNELNAGIMSAEAPGGVLRVEFTGKRLQKWIVEFRFLNLKTDHGQLDVMHQPGGTDGYQDLARNAETIAIGDIEVRVAALEDIIRSKQAVGGERDLEQLPTLRMLLEQKREMLRPGMLVHVPSEPAEVVGTIIEIRGVGPTAEADVRVATPEGAEEVRSFPLSSLRAAR